MSVGWTRVLVVGAVMVLLSAGMATAAEIRGDSGDEFISGTTRGDNVYARGGDDAVYGLRGDDTIRGGEGDDALYGNRGQDAISGDGGTDLVYGGWGNDLLYTAYGLGSPIPASSPASPDIVRGERGDDFIVSRDLGGAPDTVYCGDGHDEVYADGEDFVVSGCEVVHYPN